MKVAATTSSRIEVEFDIVCGMELSATEIMFVLDGRQYYFCSEGCRAEFLRHADDYVTQGPPPTD